MQSSYDGRLLDITAPEHAVQVDWSDDGDRLWITVDGTTVLRICRIPSLEVTDKPLHDVLPIVRGTIGGYAPTL